jgi:MoaD family protein
VAQLRLFAAAREAAGTSRAVLPGATVAEVLAAAVSQFGSDFERVLSSCKIWVNGEAVEANTPVSDSDEVAVLPPVSGGQ